MLRRILIEIYTGILLFLLGAAYMIAVTQSTLPPTSWVLLPMVTLWIVGAFFTLVGILDLFKIDELHNPPPQLHTEEYDE